MHEYDEVAREVWRELVEEVGDDLRRELLANGDEVTDELVELIIRDRHEDDFNRRVEERFAELDALDDATRPEGLSDA